MRAEQFGNLGVRSLRLHQSPTPGSDDPVFASPQVQHRHRTRTQLRRHVHARDRPCPGCHRVTRHRPHRLAQQPTQRPRRSAPATPRKPARGAGTGTSTAGRSLTTARAPAAGTAQTTRTRPRPAGQVAAGGQHQGERPRERPAYDDELAALCRGRLDQRQQRGVAQRLTRWYETTRGCVPPAVPGPVGRTAGPCRRSPAVRAAASRPVLLRRKNPCMLRVGYREWVAGFPRCGRLLRPSEPRHGERCLGVRDRPQAVLYARFSPRPIRRRVR